MTLVKIFSSVDPLEIEDSINGWAAREYAVIHKMNFSRSADFGEFEILQVAPSMTAKTGGESFVYFTVVLYRKTF